MPILPPFLAPLFTRVGGLLQVVGFPGAGTAETMFDITDVITAAAAAQSAAEDSALDAALALNRATWDSLAFFGDEMRYTVGTPIYALSTAAPYLLAVATTTNLASCYMRTQMRQGTWTLRFWTGKRPDAANLSVSIDGNIIVNQLNLYQATNNFLYLHTVTGVVVGTNPIKEIVFLADGHTNPSSGYVMAISKVWAFRTGD